MGLLESRNEFGVFPPAASETAAYGSSSAADAVQSTSRNVAVPATPDVAVSGAPFFGARRACYIFFAYLAAQLIFQMLVLVGTGVKFGLEGGDPNDTAAIDAALQFIAGPAAAAGAAISGLLVASMVLRSSWGPSAGGRPAWLGLGTNRQLAEGFAAGVALSVLYLALASTLYPPSADVEPGPLQSLALSADWRQVVWVAFALLVAPPLEELLFRGVLFSGFAASWGVPAAAAISSTVFVLLHYTEVAGYVPAMAAIATLALVTVRIRLRTGKIGPAIAAHFGYNFTIVAQALAILG